MSPVALLFIFYCIHRCIVVQVLAKMSPKKKQDNAAPPPKRSYTRSALGIAVFSLMALATAFLERIPVLGSRPASLKVIFAAIAFLVFELICDRIEWTYTPIPDKIGIWLLLPHTHRDRLYLVLWSLVVSVSEEVIYRAVLFGVFLHATDNLWIAAGFSAVLFAFSHLYAGWLAAVSSFIAGVGLQLLFMYSGGLYLPIAVHFLHNTINGFYYGAQESPGSLGAKRRGRMASFS